MLVIRSEQLEPLRLAQHQMVVEQVVSYLQARYPEKSRIMDENGLREAAVFYIETAVKNGVTTTQSITVLCGWFFELGDQFERSLVEDTALAILRNPTIPGRVKVLLIAEYLEKVAPETNRRES